jgi:glycosyltransferase involved in cell wall biosynthesis
MAKRWIAAGCSVSIIAASVSHLRSIAPEISATVTRENIDGIDYIWVKTPDYAGNGLRRLLNIFSFVLKIRRNSKWLAKELLPDVVIASSTYPLDILAAEKLARTTQAKLIFEVHDLWPLSPMELGGMSKYHPFIMLMQYAENRAYHRADKVVSMLPAAKAHMVEHGMREDKFEYIPNGVNVEEWSYEEDESLDWVKTIRGLKKTGVQLVGYAGSHGLANALNILIDSANLLKEEKIVFVLVGQGPEKEQLRAQAQSLGLSKIFFFSPIPKRLIPQLLSYMDILYIGAKRQPLYRFGICPNKIMDYMMAGRPIVQAIESANNMVEDANCGIAVRAEDPNELSKAIYTLSQLSHAEKERLGKNAKEYVLKNHNYEILAQKFEDLF